VAWLLVLVPAAAGYLSLDVLGFEGGFRPSVLVGAFLVSGAMAVLGLLSGSEMRAALGAVGGLSFGLPYFTLAIVSYAGLHQISPWLLLLLLVIVWSGDSAAYMVGTRWGRKKLAPVVSPNKTWLGAVAGFAIAVLGAAAFCQLRFQEIDLAILVAAAAAAIAAQLGDLVESLFKRAAGVKDSGDLLPGHGGMLDRMDAILLAAPTLYLTLRALGAA